MTSISNTYKENELSSRLRNGDKLAFRQLYDLYSKKLYAFAVTYLKSKSEAEEVIQVVFVKLWENRNDIRDDLSLQSYLYKITINKIYNIFKYKKLRAIDDDFASVERPDNSTLEKIQFDSLSENVDKLIEQLPEQRKIIFRLSRMEGLSHEEIATKMKISVRTVESQIYKALKFLKKHLKNEFILLITIMYS